jgi:hypothetical protein
MPNLNLNNIPNPYHFKPIIEFTHGDLNQDLINAVLQPQLVNNTVLNATFYAAIAQQFAARFLPYNRNGNSGKIIQDQINNDGKNIALNISNNPTTNVDGYFNKAIIPNLILTSSYRLRNFFDSTINDQETITLNIPIATISISQTNNYVESMPIGYQGNIQEFVNSSSYKLQIEGLFIAKFVGDDPLVPDQNRPDVTDFVTMCTRNKEFNLLNNWISNKTGINTASCIIKSFSLPADPTMKNIQRFTIEAETNTLIQF